MKNYEEKEQKNIDIKGNFKASIRAKFSPIQIIKGGHQMAEHQDISIRKT